MPAAFIVPKFLPGPKDMCMRVYLDTVDPRSPSFAGGGGVSAAKHGAQGRRVCVVRFIAWGWWCLGGAVQNGPAITERGGEMAPPPRPTFKAIIEYSTTKIVPLPKMAV